MKFVDYFRSRTHRDIVLYAGALGAVGLSLLAVFLDETYGESVRALLYAMQALCVVGFLAALVMVVINIWVRAGKKHKLKQEQGK